MKRSRKVARDIVPDDFHDMFEEVFYNFISRNVEWDWLIMMVVMEYRNNVDTGELTINHTQRHTEDYEYPVEDNPITKALA